MKRSKILLPLIAFFGVTLIGYQSLFTVELGEQVVVERFGRILSIEKSGGLKLKSPFDRAIRYRPHLVQRLEVGFRSDPDQKNFSDRNANPQLWEMKHKSISKNTKESLVITKDENIVDVNCVIHYQIKDLKQYLVNIGQPEVFLRNIAEASIRNLLGKEGLERILVENKFQLQADLMERIQMQLNQHHSGIILSKVSLQDVHPPVEVVLSFRDVTSAREDKNTKIYTAEEYNERQLPKARGKAHQRVEMAKASSEEVILKSSGDKSRFTSLGTLTKRYGKELRLKKYYDYISDSYKKSKLLIISKDLFKDLEFIRPATSSKADEQEINYGN